jgi:hypothetical protein
MIFAQSKKVTSLIPHELHLVAFQLNNVITTPTIK